MRIVVVRHAIAEPKKGWTGVDAERPLVARGRRQAARLGRIVGPIPPDRILSSPAVRCRQTAEPLAAQLGREVRVADALATDAGKAATELCHELLDEGRSGSTVMLCTHREVIEVLLPQLAKEYGHKLAHRPPGAKGGAWTLRFGAGRLQKVDYRPPTA